MKRKQKQDLTALLILIVVVVVVSSAFLLVGCKVKTKSHLSAQEHRVESIVNTTARDSLATHHAIDSRLTTTNTSSVFESWLSGSVDLELNVKTYGRDSAGSFLLSESTMKKRETTEGRSKSESFTSIIDSVVQSKLDSISLLESVRQQSDIEASSKVKHDTKRTVDGVSWIPVVIVLLIIICVIYLRGTGALTFKSIKSLWSKKQ